MTPIKNQRGEYICPLCLGESQAEGDMILGSEIRPSLTDYYHIDCIEEEEERIYYERHGNYADRL